MPTKKFMTSYDKCFITKLQLQRMKILSADIWSKGLDFWMIQKDMKDVSSVRLMNGKITMHPIENFEIGL